MDEPMDDSVELEGGIDFSAPTPPHEATAADIFGSPAGELEHDTYPQSPAASQVSIDFSVATVESQKEKMLPFLGDDNEHDSFEFDASFDLFSDGGKKDGDDQSVSDVSADEGTKPKERKHKKEKKEKKHSRRESSPKETEEKVIKSTVNEEIEVVKKLENGPTKAELARRSLIEIDQDELEERVERLNRVTLKVIAKALGLSKIEQHQKIVECREFLKKNWDDGPLGDFIADTIARQNSRIYGVNQAPGLDALDYLDKEAYSDDEWDVEEELEIKKEEAADIAPVAVSPEVESSGAAIETKSSFIELSDSEDEDEDELEIALAVPVAPVAPVLSAAELAAQQRTLQIQRMKDAAAEKERLELEQRKQRFLAASKISRSSRSALLTTLREKVQATAKENYCNQRKVKINSDELTLRLQIADRCRQLVELLKERHESRDNFKREARKAKYQKLADADDEEFDSDADLNALGEGEYLTAEERAAYLRRFEADYMSDESSIEDGDLDAEGDEEMEVEELAPVDEERQGLQNVLDKEESATESGSESDDESSQVNTQSNTQIDTQMDTQLDTQLHTQDEDEDEEVRVQRSKRSSRPTQGSPVTTQGGAMLKYGRVRLGTDTAAHEEDDLLIDEQERVATGPTQLETQLTGTDEDAQSTTHSTTAHSKSADLETDDVSLMGETVATKSKSKKSRSTGNTMYRLALEEEERRHRRHKGNNLVDDEAAEEEEEGMQAGLGDFGFGVTSNIREHDEEMNALKVRKGDFDNIVDDISDDEGDEAAGALARAEMELKEDKARDRAIITAVTEGHDAMRNKAKKGAFSFEKLVGDNALLASRRRRKGEEGPADEGAAVEEEEDEEELMQRGMQNRTDREKLSRARKGTTGGSDSDSDSAGESEEEDLLDQLDSSDMTEAEKRVEIERMQRLRDKNRMDALMAKQRIQSYKMARERVRQEKLQRQLLQQQSESQSQQHDSQGLGGAYGSSSGLSGLLRQDSMSGAPRVSRSLTLEPLHDEYSRMLMQRTESVSQPQLTSSSSGSNLMPPPTISPRGVVPSANGGLDGKLADITNVQIKRRTTLVPKHSVANDKRTMRRAQSTTSSSGSNAVQSGLYKGELNRQEVQEGFGMGMAVKAQKVDISNGLFSAVTGIRRFGDLAAANTSSKHSFTTLKKRTFSEVGKLGSTVAAQQFVFGADDGGSRMDSNSGFGSRSGSVQAPKRPLGSGSNSGFQIPGGSLFAQLGAKRGRT